MSVAPRIRLPLKFVYQIAERDRWTCHICKQRYLANDRWVIDHDQALARGGPNLLRNLRLAHARCNQGKAAS